MKKISVNLIFLLFCISGSMNAQDQRAVFMGIIMDSVSNVPLQNVRIYCRDTVPVYSDIKGQFQIWMKSSDNLHFRKCGFAYHTEKITGKRQVIYLSKSNPEVCKNMSKKYPKGKPDVIFDGLIIPDEEWSDALSMDPSEIRSIEFIEDQAHTKDIFMINSIFQWNRER